MASQKQSVLSSPFKLTARTARTAAPSADSRCPKRSPSFHWPSINGWVNLGLHNSNGFGATVQLLKSTKSTFQWVVRPRRLYNSMVIFLWNLEGYKIEGKMPDSHKAKCDRPWHLRWWCTGHRIWNLLFQPWCHSDASMRKIRPKPSFREARAVSVEHPLTHF